MIPVGIQVRDNIDKEGRKQTFIFGPEIYELVNRSSVFETDIACHQILRKAFEQ